MDNEKRFDESFISSGNFSLDHEEDDFILEANITVLKVKDK